MHAIRDMNKDEDEKRDDDIVFRMCHYMNCGM